MTCEHDWFKQMCKDKSDKEQTTNFLTLLSRLVWKLFSKFPRHWRHQFCSLLVQRGDKQSGTERRGVRTLYDNDTRDREHIVVHPLSALFMICMLMSFSTIIPWGIIWMYWFSNCHMNQSLDCFCCFSVFSCQQFIFCGRIILAGAMWGWQGSKEAGRGGSWGVEG